jgi:hypothetical protein
MTTHDVYTLAVDPGAETGFALFYDGLLCQAWSGAPNTGPKALMHRLVVEWPRERTGGRHVSTAALLVLAGHAGEVIGSVPHKVLERVFPDVWKGTIPKPRKGAPYIIEQRVHRILDAEELALVPAGAKHDIWDAIGLGLFALGRARRGLT